MFRRSKYSNVAFHPLTFNGRLDEIRFCGITFEPCDPELRLSQSQRDALYAAYAKFSEDEDSAMATEVAGPELGSTPVAEAAPVTEETQSEESLQERINKGKFKPAHPKAKKHTETLPGGRG